MRYLVLTLILMGCASEIEVEEWENDSLIEDVSPTDGNTYDPDCADLHDQYIHDACANCPECCDAELWDGGDDAEEEDE